jgi:putative ABC transport system permease protein
MRNTTSQIRDISGADIWVMDPSVNSVDDITPLSDDDLYRVRGVSGVAWAVPLYKGLARAQFREGNFKQFIVLGLDDQTLVGAPTEMLLGSIGQLRSPDAVIIDEYGYRYLWPNRSLQTGATFEMNDHRAIVVGICRASPTFQTFPIVYTTYSQALSYSAQERRTLTFILAKAEPGLNVDDVCERINRQTGRLALSQKNFTWMTISYYLRRTGIPINFGTTVLLGFIIGASIAGQTFYLFTISNIRYFAALKAMGLTNRRIIGMVLVQGFFVGTIGYCLGLGATCALEEYLAMKLKTIPLASDMVWQIPAGTAIAMAMIVIVTSVFSLHRVLRLEPAAAFH